MYIETVTNRNSPSAILLREGWREGSKTHKRTLANLSHRSKEKIETLRRWLRDEPLVSPQDLLATRKTLPHGHVDALLLAIRKLGLDTMISAKPCRERDLVLAMIVEPWLDSGSKLASTRPWHSTTLVEELAMSEALEDELYPAMDWLFERQPRTEKKLAARPTSARAVGGSMTSAAVITKATMVG
jgi:ribosomal protein L35